MKKLLGILAIIILFALILAPPLLRIYYKDEEVIVPKDKVEVMLCNKDDYTINISYLNEEIYNLVFKFKKDDKNLDNYKEENNIEFNLHNTMKNTSNVIREEESEENVTYNKYSLLFKGLTPEVKSNFGEFSKKIDDQKAEFENNKYVCNVVER